MTTDHLFRLTLTSTEENVILTAVLVDVQLWVKESCESTGPVLSTSDAVVDDPTSVI